MCRAWSSSSARRINAAMANLYLWTKVVHLLAVISWMAGLLYLPRLFVYHSDCEPGSASDQIFQVMERRLHGYIMTPAMIVTLLSGLVLAGILGEGGTAAFGWFWVKIVSVLILVAVHLRLGWHLTAFAKGRNRFSGRYFRVLNEIPTLLLIAIVVMVVLKPF
jgi:putative membrane protein